MADLLNAFERKLRIFKHNLNSHTLKYFPLMKHHLESTDSFDSGIADGNGTMQQF